MCGSLQKKGKGFASPPERPAYLEVGRVRLFAIGSFTSPPERPAYLEVGRVRLIAEERKEFCRRVRLFVVEMDSAFRYVGFWSGSVRVDQSRQD